MNILSLNSVTDTGTTECKRHNFDFGFTTLPLASIALGHNRSRYHLLRTLPLLPHFIGSVGDRGGHHDWHWRRRCLSCCYCKLGSLFAAASFFSSIILSLRTAAASRLTLAAFSASILIFSASSIFLM